MCLFVIVRQPSLAGKLNDRRSYGSFSRPLPPAVCKAALHCSRISNLCDTDVRCPIAASLGSDDVDSVLPEAGANDLSMRMWTACCM